MEIEATIHAPLEQVFHAITDPELSKKWMEGAVEITPISGSLDQVGARFKQKMNEGGKLVEYDGRVTEYEKPRRLAVEVINSNLKVTVAYRLSEAGTGTRLKYSMEFEGQSFLGRLMSPVLGAFSQVLCQKQITKLKLFTEAGQA